MSAFSAWMMTTSPPFMSMMPGPRAVFGVEPFELLERTVALEDGVEMADQQDLRRRARVACDEMAGALPGGAVDPLRLESERVELGAKDRADLPHAVEVLRAAVDIDDALEERDGLVLVGVDRDVTSA